MAELTSDDHNLPSSSVMPERVYMLAVGVDGDDIDLSAHTTKKEVTAITGLNMTASLHTSFDKSNSSSDDVEIKIFNLNATERNRYEAEGCAVILRAGYSFGWERGADGYVAEQYEKLPVLFTGHILHSYTERQGVDMVTTLYCSTDNLARSSIKVSHSWQPKTKKVDILKWLVGQFGMPVTEFKVNERNNQQTYPSGYAVHGAIDSALNRICGEMGLLWAIERGQIRVLPSEHTDSQQVWTLNSYNLLSMAGGYSRTAEQHPAAKANAKRKAQQKKKDDDLKPGESVQTVPDGAGGYLTTKTRNTIRCKLFLAPELRLGDCVQFSEDLEQFLGSDEMRALNAKGKFRIVSMSHELDYNGGSWTTDLELAATKQE